MIVYNFSNDYSEGCHPSILDALNRSNSSQQIGYGEDEHSLKAACLLRNLCLSENAHITFVAGGTLANLTILSSILKPYESIISVSTAHINTHEAGAIEATGHKIESVESADGKLSPEKILPLLNKNPKYHTVKPKVVYISNSTELGTIYQKDELANLYDFCKSKNLLLFMDGARLAMALASEKNDMNLCDIAKFTDIFYLGGTKCGALLGEAIVITNENIKEDFKYNIKQRGAMLAKGRILGIQFEELLKQNSIIDLAKHANLMASKIAEEIKNSGYTFLAETYTNQLFPILPNDIIEKLSEKYGFIIWRKIDENYSAIRLTTSWSTPENIVNVFINDFRAIHAETNKSL